MLRKSCEASLAQVTGMEVYSHVPISVVQKEVYVALRETEGLLTDQRLLANIIARTTPSNLTAFWNAYPNIFGDELATITSQAA